MCEHGKNGFVKKNKNLARYRSENIIIYYYCYYCLL